MSKCRHDWVPYDTSYKAGGWEGQICTKCGDEEVAPDPRDVTIDDLRAQLAQREGELEALREAARRVTTIWNETNPDHWYTDEWNDSHDALAALVDNQEDTTND